MIVNYYETVALVRLPHQTRFPTLDDLHKQAWLMFGYGPRDAALTERPFIFRFEPFDDRRTLITLRCDRPFKGAQAHRVVVENGATIEVDYLFFPRRRHKRKAWTPKSEEWASIGAAALQRAGLDLCSEISDKLLDYRKLKAHRPCPALPAVNLRCQATITDVQAFAGAFLDGIGSKRGYGAGLIRLAPDSPTQAERAA